MKNLISVLMLFLGCSHIYGQTMPVLNNNNALTITPDQIITTKATLADYSNTVAGNQAGAGLTDGTFNIGVGNFALQNMAVGNRNIAIGYEAMQNAESNFNIGVGYRTLRAVNGLRNIAFGYNTLPNLTTGYDNIIFQRFGNNSLINGNKIISIGSDNLVNSNGQATIAIGNANLQLSVSGLRNIAIGQSNFNKSTLSLNIGLGDRNFINCTTCTNNTAFGYNNFEKTTTGSDNIGLGTSNFISSLTGKSNIGLGQFNFNQSLDSSNIAIGSLNANELVGGNSHICIGNNIMRFSTNDNKNISIGHSSLYNGFAGIRSNTLSIGRSAGYNIGTGKGNIFMGYFAANQTTLKNGDNNIIIGSEAKFMNTTNANISNSAAIGSGSEVEISNKYVFGTASTAVISAQVLPTVVSDLRKKNNIVYTDDLGLQFVKLLKPARYSYIDDAQGRVINGLIAQDVQESLTQLGLTFSGLKTGKDQNQILSLAYADFTIPLINAVKELDCNIQKLKNEVANLEVEVQTLEKIAAIIKNEYENSQKVSED